MSHPDTKAQTDTVLTHLAATGLEVGDAVAPANNTRPYLVVFPLSPFDVNGPLGDHNADHALEYQITAVGDTREQAEWAQTKARDTMLGSLPTPPAGYGYMQDADVVPAVGVQRDDETQPPLFYAADIYRLWVTPS